MNIFLHCWDVEMWNVKKGPIMKFNSWANMTLSWLEFSVKCFIIKETNMITMIANSRRGTIPSLDDADFIELPLTVFIQLKIFYKIII